mgnify:CR=1 FL=1
MYPERGGHKRYHLTGDNTGRPSNYSQMAGDNFSAYAKQVVSGLKSLAKSAWAGIRQALKLDTKPIELPRRHQPDYLIPVLMLTLAAIGFITLFSIVPAITRGDDGESSDYMFKQFVLLLVSLVAFATANRIPLDIYRRASFGVFIVGVVLCFALPILGRMGVPGTLCTLGACRWYVIGIGTFQPAELLKLGSVLFMAGLFATQAAHGRIDTWDTVWRFLAVIVIDLVIVAGMQKDLGSGIALVAILSLQLFVSGIGRRKLYVVGAIVLAMGVLAIVVAPHRMQRIMTFIGGGTEKTDYHINQAMVALGSGGLTGRGLGQSVQAFGWLPEAVNDSIFAIYGEMLGWLGVMLLIMLFGALLYAIISKFDYTKSYFLRMVVAGVFGWLAAHVLMNIGAMTHMIPLTGITLPLVSLGGTSMAFVMFALGMVFSISHYTTYRRVDDKISTGENDESSMCRRRQRRPHNTNRRGN